MPVQGNCPSCKKAIRKTRIVPVPVRADVAVLDGHAFICGACSEVLSVALDWKKIKAELIDAAVAGMRDAA